MKAFKRIDRVPHIRQAPFLCFLHPLLGIVVAVEDDPAVLLVGLLDDGRRLGVLVLCFFQTGRDLVKASAAMVFSATFGPAIDWAEPTILNSNLLPVKAKGEVLFRSVLSLGMTGRVSTPTLMKLVAPGVIFCPFEIFSRISVNSSPMKMEMMAGGASLAPSRWSFAGARAGGPQDIGMGIDCLDQGAQEKRETGRFRSAYCRDRAG